MVDTTKQPNIQRIIITDRVNDSLSTSVPAVSTIQNTPLSSSNPVNQYTTNQITPSTTITTTNYQPLSNYVKNFLDYINSNPSSLNPINPPYTFSIACHN